MQKPENKQLRKEREKVESPIEELLLRELHLLGLYPAIQFKVGNYRIDLAFPNLLVGIECDGKEWHSTEKQIAYDNQRDDYLRKNGWTIVRFSGLDIYQKADDIAKFLAGQKDYIPIRKHFYNKFETIENEYESDDFLDLEKEEIEIEDEEKMLEETDEQNYIRLSKKRFYSIKEIISERYKYL